MENKLTEATRLRPGDDRLLNARLVEINLNKFIAELKQETTWADSDHNSITVFKSDTSTIVLIRMRENAALKEHTAIGNISVQVLSGEINFFAEQQALSLGTGQMIILEANIPHKQLNIMDHSIISQNNTNRINCYKHHHCCNKCKYVESKIDNKKK